MECSSGSGLDVVGCSGKKKRSSIPRRPRPDLRTLLPSYTFLPQSSQPIASGGNEGNQNFRDNIVGSDGLGSENKLKLKLKFGGITHTIQTNSTVDSAPQNRQKQVLQDKHNSYSYPLDKVNNNGVRKKDISRSGSSYEKGHCSRGKTSGDSVYMNETYESVRKSKRVPKRRALDVGFDGDDDDEDDELRYLGRLNAPKVAARYENEEVGGIGKERVVYEDKDYLEEEEEPTSDEEPGSKRKKLEKGPLDSFVGRNESTPTTRNRALQSGKDLSGSGASLIEFPNGLPPPPPKKQKEKLSEVEQQLKKAEAAQRRRMQSEKAAREAEAEAIRKILGQDPGRKKKEEKKQQDELAQSKAAKSNTLASNTVRWVFGPSGTVVIFSEDIGLPSLFKSGPCSYPPPREKCAGPNCTNAYKYRDSKSKLPLCSLRCYRAMLGKMQPLITC